MDRLWRHRLAQMGVCWTKTAAGIPWKLDLRNATDRWIVYGEYEGPGFLKWARRHLSADGIVVDSGANIGQMLLYLGQFVPRGTVLAFEPGQIQADWLAECLLANPQLPVELIRRGLSDQNADVFLQDSGTNATHGAQSIISKLQGAAVKVVPLEQALTERGIQRIDLWKLDVEGHEVQAMEGARGWLKSDRIRALYVELHGENGVRIRDYLAPLGYQCFLINANGCTRHLIDLPEHANGLFLPREL